MGNNQMVSMSVDPDVVNAIIKKNIETSMLAAMGDTEQKGAVLDAIVMSAINTKVDHEGKVSKYPSDNRYDYLELKVQQVIRGAVVEALNEYVDKKSSTLRRLVKKSIEENSEHIAGNLVKSFSESAGSAWRFKLDINVDTSND